MTSAAKGLLLVPEGWTYEVLRALRRPAGMRPDPVPSSDVAGVRIPSLALAHEAAQRTERAPVGSIALLGALKDVPVGVELCSVQDRSGESYRVVSDGAGGFDVVPS